jgi:Leucine-rich repeat (LRR) protein
MTRESRSLNLKFIHLRALPACIGKLQRLKSLFAAFNRLEALPDSQGELDKLDQAYIYANNIIWSGGHYPVSLTRLRKLKELWIDYPEPQA